MWSMSREQWEYRANKVYKIKIMLKKIIRMTMKTSKMSIQSMMKNLEMRKSLKKRFRSRFFMKRTGEKRSIRENDFFVEYFSNCWGYIQVWSDYLLVF